MRSYSLQREALWGKECSYCFAPIYGDGHWEHIIPRARGGPWEAWNILYVHAKCNLSKGSLTLEQAAQRQGWDLERIYKAIRESHLDIRSVQNKDFFEA